MGLQELDPLSQILGNRNIDKYYQALKVAESFYMMLEEQGYSSVREVIFWTHINRSVVCSGSRSEAITMLIWAVTAHRLVNPQVADSILDDLNLIQINRYGSLMNFLCEVRRSNTKPKSEQRNLAVLN